jgi:hypothetical protein
MADELLECVASIDEIVKEFYGEDEEVCDESTSEYQNT